MLIDSQMLNIKNMPPELSIAVQQASSWMRGQHIKKVRLGEHWTRADVQISQ